MNKPVYDDNECNWTNKNTKIHMHFIAFNLQLKANGVFANPIQVGWPIYLFWQIIKDEIKGTTTQ